MPLPTMIEPRNAVLELSTRTPSRLDSAKAYMVASASGSKRASTLGSQRKKRSRAKVTATTTRSDDSVRSCRSAEVSSAEMATSPV